MGDKSSNESEQWQLNQVENDLDQESQVRDGLAEEDGQQVQQEQSDSIKNDDAQCSSDGQRTGQEIVVEVDCQDDDGRSQSQGNDGIVPQNESNTSIQRGLTVTNDKQESVVDEPEQAETPVIAPKVAGEAKSSHKNQGDSVQNSGVISSKGGARSRGSKSRSRPPGSKAMLQSSQKTQSKDILRSEAKGSETQSRKSKQQLTLGIKQMKTNLAKSFEKNGNEDNFGSISPRSQVQPQTAGLRRSNQSKQESLFMPVPNEPKKSVEKGSGSKNQEQIQTQNSQDELNNSKNNMQVTQNDEQKEIGKGNENDTRSQLTDEQLKLLKSFEDAIIQKAKEDIEREEYEQSMKDQHSTAQKINEPDKQLDLNFDEQSIANANRAGNYTPQNAKSTEFEQSPIKIDRNVNNSVATQQFNIMNELNDQMTKYENEKNESKQSVKFEIENQEVAPENSQQDQEQKGENQEEEDEEEKASEESFDPVAEYERLQKAEAERMQNEMQQKLKEQMSNMFKKMKDHILVLDKSKNLPPELPKNLIYWHRCQTEVCNQDVISNEFLNDFYQTEFKWHEDQNGEIGKVSDKLPFFRSKPIFINEEIQYGPKPRYVNKSEEKILKDNKWPQGFVKYDIEGKIMIAKPNERSVFFNAKFESGNLRQVFKADLRKSKDRPGTPPETQLPRDVDPAVLSEYNLYLQDDTNSDNSLTQWFYFGCTNVKAGTVVKLNMLNLMKDDSLYSLGMQPFVYSQKRHLQGDGVKWHREGFNIEYYFNDLTIRTSNKTMDMDFDPRYVGNVQDKFKKTSTLSFSYEFKYDNDIVFFAHFAPYSYSDVFRYLCKLELDQKARSIMRIDYICKSLGGVPMYGMTITNNIQTDYISQEQEIQLYRQFEYEELDIKPKKKKLILPGLPGYVDPATVQKSLAEIAHDHLTIKRQRNYEKTDMKLKEPEKHNAGQPADQQHQNNQHQWEEEKKEPKYKKFLFLTSRVHPGETNSQYMMQGCIEFLMSDHPVANEMRNHFIFKIIPILNPDGTVHGNYRASLLGVDLNRRWKNPSRYLHPTIYYTKSLIKFCNALGQQHDSESGGVVFSCDMHGHSRNLDIFQYACKVFGDELQTRLPNQVIWSIPEHATHFCPIFNPNNCKMSLEKDKEATARIVLFKEFGILNSYTLEATFYGSESFKKQRKPEQWIKAIDETMQEDINNRYKISDTRTDIHIETDDLLYLGHDWLKAIHFASLRRPLGNYWFDEPRKVEEIRAKEAALIAAQEKQLEEIRAKEKEAARLAKIAEKERIKEEKRAEKAKKQLEERIARLKAKGIEINEDNIKEMERIEEEVLSEVHKKKRKKKKKKNAEFAAWDDDGKRVKPKRQVKYEEIEDKDGNIIKIKQGRKSRIPMEIKVENKRKQSQLPQIRSPDRQRNDGSNDGMPSTIEQRVQNDIHIIKQAFEVRNSKKFMSIKPGQIMGLGDHLMLQYNQLTQRQQEQQQQQQLQKRANFQQNQNLLGASRFQPRGPFDTYQKNQKGTNYPTSNYKNKMIDLVDQILIKSNGQPADDNGIGSYQQNILFPQYGQMQKRNDSEMGKAAGTQYYRANKNQGGPTSSNQLQGMLPLTNQQQQQIDHNTHKLRQVSQLMNEMVRNKGGAAPENMNDSYLYQQRQFGGMPDIMQQHLAKNGGLSMSQIYFKQQNDGSYNDAQQQRMPGQNLNEDLLSGWNREAQNQSLTAKDVENGHNQSAVKDNTALGLQSGTNTHSRTSLTRLQQPTDGLRSVAVSRNFSNSDSKKYQKFRQQGQNVKIAQNSGNMTIESAMPFNLSVIDEKVIKLQGQAVKYAQGMAPNDNQNQNQEKNKQGQQNAKNNPNFEINMENSLEQAFQKAKKQEIERRKKEDSSFQHRKKQSIRIQYNSQESDTSANRIQKSRSSSRDKEVNEELEEQQMLIDDKQSDQPQKAMNKSQYREMKQEGNDNQKDQLEVSKAARVTQNRFSKLNNTKYRTKMSTSKLSNSRQQRSFRATKQYQSKRLINQQKMFANSSEEDLQQYLKQRRIEGDYKENAFNDTSDDDDEEAQSSSSNDFDDNENSYRQDNNVNSSVEEVPSKQEEGSALDKYTYHKMENDRGGIGQVSPLVFSDEKLKVDDIGYDMNNVQVKNEHVPSKIAQSQVRNSYNKFTSFVNNQSPQPVINSIKAHNINLSNNQIYQGKTQLDEINNQKLLRNQRAIITKAPGLHKLCNFGPKSISRQKSNDGLKQSIVLLKNQSQSNFGKTSHNQGTLFQRQKNSVQQDTSNKNVLLNSGDNHWLGNEFNKAGAVVILGNNSATVNSIQAIHGGSNQGQGQVDLKYKFHSSSTQHNKNNSNSQTAIKKSEQQNLTVFPNRSGAPLATSIANNHKQKETAHSMVDTKLILPTNVNGSLNVVNQFGLSDPRSTKSHNTYHEGNPLSTALKNDRDFKMQGKTQLINNNKSEYSSFAIANQGMDYQRTMQKLNYQSQNVSAEMSPRRGSAYRRYNQKGHQNQQYQNRQSEQRNPKMLNLNSLEEQQMFDKNSFQPTIFKNQLLQNITSSEQVVNSEVGSQDVQNSNKKASDQKSIKLPEIQQANVITRVLPPNNLEVGQEMMTQLQQHLSKQRQTNQSHHVSSTLRSHEKIQSNQNHFSKDGIGAPAVSFLRSPTQNMQMGSAALVGGQGLHERGMPPKTIQQIKNSKMMQ